MVEVSFLRMLCNGCKGSVHSRDSHGAATARLTSNHLTSRKELHHIPLLHMIDWQDSTTSKALPSRTKQASHKPTRIFFAVVTYLQDSPHGALASCTMSNRFEPPPRQRASRACNTCRVRKVKCTSNQSSGPCVNCKRCQTQCVFDSGFRAKRG